MNRKYNQCGEAKLETEPLRILKCELDKYHDEPKHKQGEEEWDATNHRQRPRKDDRRRNMGRA